MLNPDYRDILSIFSDEAVEYLPVGAYALAAHGHPRARFARGKIARSLRVGQFKAVDLFHHLFPKIDFDVERTQPLGALRR